MKNTLFRLIFLLFSCFPAYLSGQNYQAELSKVNTYLKTFDKGYYGYLEVKDGYLYGRFPSGKYTKTAIQDLGTASTTEVNRKVQLSCKNNQNCVFSTYTDSYHNTLSFSQSTDFNTTELANLLNNLVQALQGKSTSVTTNKPTTSLNQSTANVARLEREKHTTQHQPKQSTTSTTKTATTAPVSSVADYSAQLNALNSYLQVFNPDTYGEVSVKGGKVYFEFKFYTQRYYSSISISDLKQKTIILQATSVSPPEVKIQCKSEAECFYSSYNEENTDHFRFFSNTVKDLGKMQRLLEDFVDALE